MAEKKDNSFAMIAIVAIVAIVAIIMLFSQGKTTTKYITSAEPEVQEAKDIKYMEPTAEKQKTIVFQGENLAGEARIADSGEMCISCSFSTGSTTTGGDWECYGLSFIDDWDRVIAWAETYCPGRGFGLTW